MAKSLSELTSESTKKAPVKIKMAKAEPKVYMFRLVEQHPKYHAGASVYPPRVYISNKDTVLWNYGTQDEPDLRPAQVRYISGHKSILVEEQEANGTLPNNIVNNQTNEIVFNNGLLVVDAWDKTKIQFLLHSNYCKNNTNKIKVVKEIFELLDFSSSDESIVDKGKLKDRAYDLARSCSEEDMIPHAKFLGIPFIHSSTGEERDLDAVREDYKSEALKDAEKFLLYANNPKIKVRFNIQKAIDKGVITSTLVKNQLHWTDSKQLITTLASDKTAIEGITDYACSEEGESFYRTLQTQI